MLSAAATGLQCHRAVSVAASEPDYLRPPRSILGFPFCTPEGLLSHGIGDP